MSETRLIRAGGANTEYDAEHESDSEPGGFALSVDLSTYMGAQARCRVWVRRRARKVRWLASRVRRVAKLRGPLLLLAGDHLLPPSEPMKVLHRDDTVRVARVEHEWQHAFSIEDPDEDAPMPTPSPTQPLSVEENIPTIQIATKQNSPKKSTKQMWEPTSNQQSPVAHKRKFTVGDTLLLLKRAEESRTQEIPDTEPEQTPHSRLSKLIENSSKLEYAVQKFIAMDQESVPVDYDELNRVKRRALALLEQVTDEKDTDVVDAPKKKRRRVRRRRPAKLSNPEDFIQELDSESGTQNASQLNFINHLNLTKQQDVQNGSKQSNLNHHVDLTEQQDDLEAKAILIKSITISPDNNQDTTRANQDSESDDSGINGPEKPALTAQSVSSVQSSKTSATPTMFAAQSSPTWTVNFIDMPPETQIPVLVRDATPRPPRVVRALGTET
ncbi:uncharacterized protein LOC133521657 [Cydia pomonella]|uniref:uncharacterized protein LOC133521657 n=1 Tax=Cydia pomonella TaxID=82600 RepID=UPI002ADDFFB8|nr:uncharacterized protein LOC133521657 [Cydia pomonella]